MSEELELTPQEATVQLSRMEQLIRHYSQVEDANDKQVIHSRIMEADETLKNVTLVQQ